MIIVKITNKKKYLRRLISGINDFTGINEMFMLLVHIFDKAAFHGTGEARVVPKLQVLHHLTETHATSMWTYYHY